MSKKIAAGMITLLLGIGFLVIFNQQNRETASPGKTRSVTDGAGRQVIIPVRPKRVVALNASNIDLYIHAGGQLVGRGTTETLSPEVKAAVAEVPSVGITPNPNLEEIVALQPDLVLGVNIPYHHALVPVLEKAGIPILLQTLENYEEVLEQLRFYGELAGEPEKAALVITGIENRSRRVAEAVNGKVAPKALIIWGTTDSFSMALSGSFSGDLVKRLGGVNIADQAERTGVTGAYLPLSLEFVAKVNPEIILFITHSSDTKVEEKFRSELKAHPAWQAVKAVQENRVYKLPYHLFAVNPGVQIGEALEVLAGLLYGNITLDKQ